MKCLFHSSYRVGQVPGIVLLLGIALCLGCDRRPLPTKPVNQIPPATEATDRVADFNLEHRARMPTRLFTPEMIAFIRRGKPYTNLFRYHCGPGEQSNAQTWYSSIPADRWQELISPFAPVSVLGSFRGVLGGQCPFCGKQYEGCAMSGEELRLTPFQAKTKCCGHIIYARETEMPPDYPARPNHVEHIPHLDGSFYDYAFYIPPGSETNKVNWFCSAGEVWGARLELLPIAIAQCGAAACFENDEKAAVYLAAIFDRLADVYPGLPLYDYNMGHGFARGRDGQSYLTREEYLSVPRPQRFEKPFWYRSNNYQFDKLRSPMSGWQDGVTWLAGLLAQSFDAIRDRREVKEWSRAKYGQADAWEKRVLERVFNEARLLCNSTPNSGHNTIEAWIAGAIKLGIVLQDPYFVHEAIRLLDENVVNNYFSDGLSTEGSFGYGALTRNLIDDLWIIEYLCGLDVNKAYPFLNRIKKLGDFPVASLYNVESMHSDEYGRFFASYYAGRGDLPPPPAAGSVDYAGHEVSQCFPEYGLGCVRAGAPGSRLEAMLDFQSAVGHTHAGKLNLQLFYEGINLLPDMGYGIGALDLTKPPWKDYRHRFELLANPDPTDWWGPWHYAYTTQPQMHCTVLIDGMNHKAGPATFHRFLGGQSLSEPGYSVQFLDVDALGVFNVKGIFRKGDEDMRCAQPGGEVTQFQRQVLTVTLPSGRALAMDVFRVKGGTRHDMYWHVPAAVPCTSLGAARTTAYETLKDYMLATNSTSPVVPGSRAGLYDPLRFISAPRRWAMPADMWQAEWHIQPELYQPVTPEGQKLFSPWSNILHEVNLRLWGGVVAKGISTGEILNARGPWPSGMMETPDSVLTTLKDALDYWVESRCSDRQPLASTFVHLLEPYTPGQDPIVKGVELAQGKGDASDGGCGLRLMVRDNNREKKSKQVLIATTANGGHFQSDNILLQGRLGVICKDDLLINLYDGVKLKTKDFGVDLEPGWSARLLDVVGDLTGHPAQSALIVDSERPLPADETLKGQMLTVYHQSSSLHTTGYIIESVSALGGQRYRLDLRGSPTFIQNRMVVRKTEGENSVRYVYGTAWLHKGLGFGLYRGRQARFLRTGFSSEIVDALHYRPGELFTDLIELKTAAGANDIAVGDAFIIHTIRAGDTVVIPSQFVLQPLKAGDRDRQIQLQMFTTGTAMLRLPDGWHPQSMVGGGVSVPLKDKVKGYCVVIEKSVIKNGRAVLQIAQ